jgi:cytochrome c oxidase subunit III
LVEGELKQPTMTSRLAQDRRSEQGAWLFLASLAVFFVSCVLLYGIYVFIRLSPGGGPKFVLPPNFILTTVDLVAISICLHMAVGAMRREKRSDVWRYIVIASILCVVFFGLQTLGMLWMVNQLLATPQQDRSLYGFTVCLVLIHAVHVVGGAAGLTFLLFGLSREAYDHERHWPIRFCALYWHFLDIVWFLMLICFAMAAMFSNR